MAIGSPDAIVGTLAAAATVVVSTVVVGPVAVATGVLCGATLAGIAIATALTRKAVVATSPGTQPTIIDDRIAQVADKVIRPTPQAPAGPGIPVIPVVPIVPVVRTAKTTEEEAAPVASKAVATKTGWFSGLHTKLSKRLEWSPDDPGWHLSGLFYPRVKATPVVQTTVPTTTDSRVAQAADRVIGPTNREVARDLAIMASVMTGSCMVMCGVISAPSGAAAAAAGITVGAVVGGTASVAAVVMGGIAHLVGARDRAYLQSLDPVSRARVLEGRERQKQAEWKAMWEPDPWAVWYRQRARQDDAADQRARNEEHQRYLRSQWNAACIGGLRRY